MIPLNRNFYLIQGLLWLSFAFLTKFTWLNSYPPSWLWTLSYMGLGFLFSSLLGLAYCKLNESSFKQVITISVIGSVIIALVWRASFNALEYHVLESANNEFKFWGYFHNGKSAVTQLLVWSFGYWLVVFKQKLVEEKLAKQQLRLDAKEAELKMLRYQIAPHFLFNVLSSIDTLLLKKELDGARNMLNKLSSYLRQTLNNESSEALNLEQELALCRRYLEIERLRFQDKLVLNWQLPEQVPDTLIPNGVLLPLLENALKHGNLSQSEQAVIDVSLSEDSTSISLQIGNNVSINGEQSHGFGLGLKNTKDRIHRFFGNKASFNVLSESHYFLVKLVIYK